MRLASVLVLLAACGGGGSGVSAAGQGGGGGVSGGGVTAKQACVSETNGYRAAIGKRALADSAELEAYADAGAMADFSSSPHDHFKSTHGGGIASAENECPNWRLPQGGDMVALVKQCVKAFYDEGPGGGHYENMMGDFGALGCGIYQQGTGVTIVQDYGD